MTESARLAVSVLSLITCACLEPPVLDDLSAPLADLGGVDTWGPLDGTPIPSFPDDDTGTVPQDPSEEGGTATADPSIAHLRITEVLVDPPGKDGSADAPEYIELQNTSTEPVILDGLRIDARSWPVLDASDLGLVGLSLDPQALLVVQRWASDVDPALTNHRVVDSATFVGFLHSGGLRNADGVMTVGAAGATPADSDELVYGVEPEVGPDAWVGAPVPSPGAARSLCRAVGHTDHDDASDWSDCAPSPGLINDTEPDKAPVEPAPIPPGAVQIVEVSANPPGPASDEKLYEFIELINLSDVEVELSGCRIGDAPTHDAAGVDPLEYLAGDGGCVSATCLAPGARALIVGQSYAGPIGLGLVLATDDSTIADGGLTNTEPVVLWDPNNAMISSYRLWPDPTGEPLPTDEQPLHRLDPAAADEAQAWISAPPSPGE